MKKILHKTLTGLYQKMKQYYWLDKFTQYREQYDISDSFKFNGETIFFYGKGKIFCGDNSYIGWFSTLNVHENCRIEIGNNCRISHNVRIYTSTNLVDQDFRNANNVEKRYGDVIIGDGVWIGVNVLINPGVRMGNNAIIAANTVISKDVPEDAIVGSAPQKIIKYKSY